MTKKTFLYIFLLFTAACANKGTKNTGKVFYRILKEQDYERIAPMLDKEVKDSLDFYLWKTVLPEIQEQRGKLLKAEPVKILKQYDKDQNQITYIEYKVWYRKAKYLEELILIKRKNSDSTKIYQYNFSVKKLEK